MRVAACGRCEQEFFDELIGVTADFARSARGCATDLAFLRADSPVDLQKIAPRFKALAQTGGIWIVYPKGVRSVTQDQVMRAIRDAGLTDNKACAFSTTHTALRAVIPVAQRCRG